ncbi:cupin domain-containing protein [Streptomyces calidiresistens]|uniref:Cupin domain-containing protein n=2 Tax=Streptomyces calidiresistens TaxID=1485586 RepID=A0A7W3T4K3_9ACTN|nr:cupin domain-containing protein [Streptomyces calidiresistens]MBB0230531.1 cupin domain-containing protein [Streptomyces calidiresistens]
MMTIVKRNFDSADEVRPFEDHKGHLDILETEHGLVGRAIFEPGWQWSKHVKPMAGTDSCEAAHTGYCVSGRMKVVMNDGDEAEYGPGDFMEIDPGHDAWVLGDEPCVLLDWTGMADYAKRMAAPAGV